MNRLREKPNEPRYKNRVIDCERLAREASKLDHKIEQAMAEEGVLGDLEEWPEY